MKTNIIALLALSALAVSPAFAAPRKMSASEDSKRAEAEASAETEEKLPRKQADARELVAELTAAQQSKLLTLLNEGSAQELAVIKGISRTRAAAIEQARPFGSIDEVVLVKGIGKGTMTEIVSHARALTTAKKKPSGASPSKASSAKKQS